MKAATRCSNCLPACLFVFACLYSFVFGGFPPLTIGDNIQHSPFLFLVVVFSYLIRDIVIGDYGIKVSSYSKNKQTNICISVIIFTGYLF